MISIPSRLKNKVGVGASVLVLLVFLFLGAWAVARDSLAPPSLGSGSWSDQKIKDGAGVLLSDFSGAYEAVPSPIWVKAVQDKSFDRSQFYNISIDYLKISGQRSYTYNRSQAKTLLQDALNKLSSAPPDLQSYFKDVILRSNNLATHL